MLDFRPDHAPAAFDVATLAPRFRRFCAEARGDELAQLVSLCKLMEPVIRRRGLMAANDPQGAPS